MKVLVAQSCTTLHDPMNRGACQSPQAIESSKQEYWTGLPFPPPGIFPIQGSNPDVLHYRQILYPLNLQGRPRLHKMLVISPVSCDSFHTVTSSFQSHVQPTMHFCGSQTWVCLGAWGAGCGWQQRPNPQVETQLGMTSPVWEIIYSVRCYRKTQMNFLPNPVSKYL